MNWIGWLIQAAFSLIVSGCLVHYVWLFFCRPLAFADLDYHGRHPDRLIEILRYPYILCAFGAMVYCIYRGASHSLSWIPPRLFDSGDLTSGESLALFVSVWLGIGAMGGMSSLARRFSENEYSRQQLLQELERKHANYRRRRISMIARKSALRAEPATVATPGVFKPVEVTGLILTNVVPDDTVGS
jgi:hypothetical protein